MMPIISSKPENNETELFTTLLYPCPDWWLEAHCHRLIQHVNMTATHFSLDSDTNVDTLLADVKQSLESLPVNTLPIVVRLEAGFPSIVTHAEPSCITFSIQLRSLPEPEKAAVLCLTPYEKPQPHLKIKTLNSQNILAETFSVRESVQKQGHLKEGYTEALWVHSQGFITEATTANFFIFRNTDDDRIQILTPPTSLCLAGTVRSWLITSAEALHIDARQTPLTWETLSHNPQGFSGAFLTNAVHGIIPVQGIFNPAANESLSV